MLTLKHVCSTQLLSAMVSKLGNMDDPLPQESFEGVDEDEWVSWSVERKIPFVQSAFKILVCVYCHDIQHVHFIFGVGYI